MASRVVVTGIGSISALGSDTTGLWQSIVAGRSGIDTLTGLPTDLLKSRIGAQVRDFNPGRYFSQEELPLLDRHAQFALVAANEAVADARLNRRDLAGAAVVLGTGCGGKETDENTYRALYREQRKRVHPLTIPRGMPSAAASQLSMQLGITGPVFAVSSACASANHAVIQATMMVRNGLVDVALAGGADAPFTYGLMKAWEAMRVLSNDTCRPFSSDRSGLVLGEGAGIVILEALDHALAREARIYGELAGCGMSADAGHITLPSRDGAVKAMLSAIEDASIGPGDVDYINAHGTGTRANDLAETQAIHQAFGAHACRLTVSSTKSIHGHALGAAGALELIATLYALNESLIPATMNFTQAGEGCDLDYVPNEARRGEIRIALSNSFAFGGLNAVVAVRRME